jgi:hypothetical protein
MGEHEKAARRERVAQRRHNPPRVYDDWRAALESLGVSLADVAEDDLRWLHTRMLTAHKEWVVASEH